jgi:hypothetical protein
MWTAVDLLGSRDWHGALTDLRRFALVPFELLLDDLADNTFSEAK